MKKYKTNIKVNSDSKSNLILNSVLISNFKNVLIWDLNKSNWNQIKNQNKNKWEI